MTTQAFERFGFAGCAAVLLAGCSVSQPPIGTPGMLSQAPVRAARDTSSNYNVLYRFRGHKNGDGAFPTSQLVDMNGVLYGTTDFGGADVAGTVFKITTNGAETTLYSFKKSPDGAFPDGGLTDVNGTLYGTTSEGGTHRGTLYTVTTAGDETVLFRFLKATKPGSFPADPVIWKGGTFYGTASAGGSKYKRGVVFGITLGSPATETILHAFGPSPDGGRPVAPVIDVGGTFYGTTVWGGATTGCDSSCGTVYSVTKSGTETVLHSFGSGTDGDTPLSGLIDVNGTLYGTTFKGGTNGSGTVFSITTSGSENVIYSFAGGADGSNPYASPIDVKGTLYGTTYYGGDASCGCGTVYSISASGTEKILHVFTGGSDGAYPQAKLLDVKGVLYGSTHYGGDDKCGAVNGCGTIFALKL